MLRAVWRRFTPAWLALTALGCASAYERSYGPNPALPAPAYGVVNGYESWMFFDALEPHGRWFDYPGHGWAWTPHGAGADWRPYWNGSWVDSDFGWTWVSNEPWGWAPYHYGRWIEDPGYGWVWIPGGEWAPAWVTWRHDDEWVGWAPLPPEAHWYGGVGLEFARSVQVPPSHWSFVERRHFLNRDLRRRALPVDQNAALIHRTRDATRFEVRHGRPYNRGIDRALVERWTRRPVPHVQVVDAARPGGRDRVSGGRLALYRPTIREPGSTGPMERRAQAVERQRRAEEQRRAGTARRREQEAVRERERAARAEQERTRAAAAAKRRAIEERGHTRAADRVGAERAERARERALEEQRARTVRAERALESERRRAAGRERELRIAYQRQLDAERRRSAERARIVERRRAAGRRTQAATAERREEAERERARAKKARDARVRASADRRGS